MANSSILLNIAQNGINDYLVNQMQGFNLTKSLIQKELTGLFASETIADMQHIMKMYEVYLEGADWVRSDIKSAYDINEKQALLSQTAINPEDQALKFRIIKALIDKEARFLFATPPTIEIKDNKNKKDDKGVLENTKLLDSVMTHNNFSSKLVRAAKDYLVGKRIAIAVNFGEHIDLNFIPSMEFIYETDPRDVDVMTKFVWFYYTVENEDKDQQRVYKKKWEMHSDGYCYIEEGVYDGNANKIEDETSTGYNKEEFRTELTEIPVYVVINEGLTGDPFGMSEVETLQDTEAWYSKLSNKDIGALEKGADQIVYFTDMNPRTTSGLSRRAGAVWDLSTDPVSLESRQGIVGTIDPSMNYSTALDLTLKRFKYQMYSQLDMPDTNMEELQGVITSGKSMTAIYWGLSVRCDEKMLDWQPALTSAFNMVIEGARAYPDAAKWHSIDVNKLSDDYTITVTNNYSILEDTTEEKNTAMQEVVSKVRSIKSYLKEFRGMDDDDADAEILQIAYETQLLESATYGSLDDGDLTSGVKEPITNTDEGDDFIDSIEE